MWGNPFIITSVSEDMLLIEMLPYELKDEYILDVRQVRRLQFEDIDELNDFLCTKIDNATNCNTKTEIYATKIDGKYNISFSDEFVDAMSGKIYSYSSNVLMDEIQSKYGGEVK